MAGLNFPARGPAGLAVSTQKPFTTLLFDQPLCATGVLDCRKLSWVFNSTRGPLQLLSHDRARRVSAAVDRQSGSSYFGKTTPDIGLVVWI